MSYDRASLLVMVKFLTLMLVWLLVKLRGSCCARAVLSLLLDLARNSRFGSHGTGLCLLHKLYKPFSIISKAVWVIVKKTCMLRPYTSLLPQVLSCWENNLTQWEKREKNYDMRARRFGRFLWQFGRLLLWRCNNLPWLRVRSLLWMD